MSDKRFFKIWVAVVGLMLLMGGAQGYALLWGGDLDIIPGIWSRSVELAQDVISPIKEFENLLEELLRVSVQPEIWQGPLDEILNFDFSQLEQPQRIELENKMFDAFGEIILNPQADTTLRIELATIMYERGRLLLDNQDVELLLPYLPSPNFEEMLAILGNNNFSPDTRLKCALDLEGLLINSLKNNLDISSISRRFYEKAVEILSDLQQPEKLRKELAEQIVSLFINGNLLSSEELTKLAGIAMDKILKENNEDIILRWTNILIAVVENGSVGAEFIMEMAEEIMGRIVDNIEDKRLTPYLTLVLVKISQRSDITQASKEKISNFLLDLADGGGNLAEQIAGLKSIDDKLRGYEIAYAGEKREDLFNDSTLGVLEEFQKIVETIIPKLREYNAKGMFGYATSILARIIRLTEGIKEGINLRRAIAEGLKEKVEKARELIANEENPGKGDRTSSMVCVSPGDLRKGLLSLYAIANLDPEIRLTPADLSAIVYSPAFLDRVLRYFLATYTDGNTRQDLFSFLMDSEELWRLIQDAVLAEIFSGASGENIDLVRGGGEKAKIRLAGLGKLVREGADAFTIQEFMREPDSPKFMKVIEDAYAMVSKGELNLIAQIVTPIGMVNALTRHGRVNFPDKPTDFGKVPQPKHPREIKEDRQDLAKGAGLSYGQRLGIGPLSESAGVSAKNVAGGSAKEAVALRRLYRSLSLSGILSITPDSPEGDLVIGYVAGNNNLFSVEQGQALGEQGIELRPLTPEEIKAIFIEGKHNNLWQAVLLTVYQEFNNLGFEKLVVEARDAGFSDIAIAYSGILQGEPLELMISLIGESNLTPEQKNILERTQNLILASGETQAIRKLGLSLMNLGNLGLGSLGIIFMQTGLAFISAKGIFWVKFGPEEVFSLEEILRMVIRVIANMPPPVKILPMENLPPGMEFLYYVQYALILVFFWKLKKIAKRVDWKFVYQGISHEVKEEKEQLKILIKARSVDGAIEHKVTGEPKQQSARVASDPTAKTSLHPNAKIRKLEEKLDRDLNRIKYWANYLVELQNKKITLSDLTTS